jgi:hypothetical protein
MKTMINKFEILILLSLLIVTSCSDDDNDTGDSPTNNTIEVSMDENPANSDLVTTISSNLSGSVTFTLTSESITNAVILNSSSGELRVGAWQVYDFETNPVISATISVSNGTDSENKIVIINLNNTDDISSFLNTSRTTYENAANGEWIKILQSEYNDLANYLTSITKSGQTDEPFQNTNIGFGGADYTVVNNNTPTMEEGSYLFAFKYYTHQNNTMDCNVKISETSYQSNFTTIGSNLPTHDTGYNYFVLKGNNTPTSTTAYLGIYESNSIGFIETSNGTDYFYESGDVEDLTNDNNNRTYLYQGLSTTQKQWD